jgi:hypothetical protein
MPWTDFQRWMHKPWWVNGNMSTGKTVNVTVKVKILSLRDYVAPSLGQWIMNPLAAEAKEALARAISGALDMEADLFTRMANNVRTGIAKHWTRTDMPNGYTVNVTTEHSDSDKAVIIVLAKGVAADLPQGIGRRSFNLATFGDGLPTVDLYNADEFARIAPDARTTKENEEMGYVGAHELGHSVLRAKPGGSILHSLTHKGSSTVGQQTAPTAPTYPSTGEVDVMLYYNNEPGIATKRYSDTKAASSDVEGLVDMCVFPPWMPG